MPIDFNKVPKYIRREIDPPARVLAKGAKNQTARRVQEWLNFHDVGHRSTVISGPPLKVA